METMVIEMLVMCLYVVIYSMNNVPVIKKITFQAVIDLSCDFIKEAFSV